MYHIKKILFFSRDPGGANCIIPLYKRIEADKNIQPHLYCRDFACQKYREKSLSFKNINRELNHITPRSIENFLKRKRPNLIITATSSDDNTERFFWRAARKLNIKTLAILDQWMNYKDRFSDDYREYPKDKKHLNIPDIICVMDEYAKGEMVGQGFPSENIKVTGQPYFEEISKEIERFNHKKKKKIRKSFNIEDGLLLISFASEPIIENNPKDPLKYGYTELTILESLLKALKKNIDKTGRKIALIIKLHPKNIDGIFDNLIKKYSFGTRAKIIVNKTLPPRDLILSSDFVLGMSSMFLIEAAILKKPIMSIQIGLKGEDPFVLSRIGRTKTVRDQKTLDNELQEFIKSKNFKQYLIKFKYIKNSTANIIKIINEI